MVAAVVSISLASCADGGRGSVSQPPADTDTATVPRSDPGAGAQSTIPAPPPDQAVTTVASPNITGTSTVFSSASGGFGEGWSDYGWSPRTTGPGAAEVDMGEYGGWVIGWASGREDLATRGPFVGVRFRYGAPAEVLEELLVLQLADSDATVFPEIRVPSAVVGADGWRRAQLLFDQLNPLDHPFDRVIIKAGRKLRSATRVRLDDIELLAGSID